MILALVEDERMQSYIELLMESMNLTTQATKGPFGTWV